MRTILTITTISILTGLSMMAQTWTQYQSSDTNITYSTVMDVTFDLSNNIWMATDRGIIKFDGNNWTQYLHSDTAMFNRARTIKADTKSNDIWVVYDAPNSGGGYHGVLTKFDGSSWTKFTQATSSIPVSPTYVSNIDVDTNGTVWLSCNEGTLSYDGTNWNHYDSTDFSNPFSSFSFCEIDKKTNTPWSLITTGATPKYMKFDGSSWGTYNNNGQLAYVLAAGSVNIIIDGLGDHYIKCSWINMVYKYNPLLNQIDSIQLNNFGYPSTSGVYSSNNLTYIPKGDTIQIYNWISKTLSKYTNPSITGRWGFQIYEDNNGQVWLFEGNKHLTLTKFNVSSLNLTETDGSNTSPLVFPNPFSSNITIQYELAKPGNIQIGLYNTIGERVSTFSENKSAGSHSFTLSPEISPGLYLLRVETPDGVSTQQLIKSN